MGPITTATMKDHGWDNIIELPESDLNRFWRQFMDSLFYRPRRLRASQLIRDMVAETRLNLAGMIQPYFVCEEPVLRPRSPACRAFIANRLIRW